MEVKLTKVELAVSTLKVQHSSDAAHIQHLITTFEEWHPIFEDIGTRLGRMEEIDDVTICLARRTEEKFHELAAGQVDLNTRLDDALESIWPHRPLTLELRHVSSETVSFHLMLIVSTYDSNFLGTHRRRLRRRKSHPRRPDRRRLHRRESHRRTHQRRPHPRGRVHPRTSK